jgi:hypothetical protein
MEVVAKQYQPDHDGKNDARMVPVIERAADG